MSQHTVNVPELRKQLEWAESHPDDWDQDKYVQRTSCGTTYCIAGKTVADHGWEFLWQAADSPSYCTKNGQGLSIEEAAAGILGLGEDEADLLFEFDNNLPRLWELAAEFTNGDIQIPIHHLAKDETT